MAADLSDDCTERLLDEQLSASDALVHEQGANFQHVVNLVLSTGARQFGHEDPIEAAAVEMILQRNV